MKAGGTFADNWAEIGDLNFGGLLTLGVAHVGGSSDEWFLSDYLVVWMMNPSVTQISDAHFLYEARYNGAELVVIDPQYSATAVHADQWVPLRTGTDAALGLCTARHIWDSGSMDLPYVREQTDLPFLVRLDTGRFLTGADLVDGGNAKLLHMWNPKDGGPAPAPGSEGSETAKLIVEGFEPPIEGTFSVTLKDGASVEVATVGTLLREQLQLWTVEATAEVTGLAPEVIEQFADGFAKAERPMVLSSWGSNRFVHSDLMNRAKLLCLSFKGAMGKKGAGYQATAFVDLTGFPSLIQAPRVGLRGKIEMLAGMATPSEMIDLIVDGVKKKRSEVDITMGLVKDGEKRMLCRTSVSTMGYHYQGIKEDLNREMKDEYPRSLEDYYEEATDKGWQDVYPKKGPPRAYISGGTNLLRRTNHTRKMLEEMWPQMKVVVSLDQKLCFTGMHSDYLLPAAGYYEKSGIKYTMAYAPYIHYCDAAVPPLGESKDEWEVYWLLSEAMQKIARERNLEPFTDCGKEPIDYKELNQVYSFQGQFGPKDAEAVTAAILDASPAAGGVSIAELKEKGISRYVSAGDNIAPTAIFNTDWNGEGVLNPFTYFTKHKWRWPTQTGRQQFYIDHPWFIEAGEALPTHREAVKGGGDRPFQMISCHCRWSIHSVWRDTPLLMRLQRGEPVVYLNPKDAEQLGIADDGWSEIYNDYGKIFMLVKYSTMVRPGVAYYFHAWEPQQFPNHESYKWLIPGLTNPMHFTGGPRQLNMSINFLQPGTFVQDTRVDIRASAGPPRADQDAPTPEAAHEEVPA
jgi:DMSO reductase family type II enzyme molybdopterin subunit